MRNRAKLLNLPHVLCRRVVFRFQTNYTVINFLSLISSINRWKLEIPINQRDNRKMWKKFNVITFRITILVGECEVKRINVMRALLRDNQIKLFFSWRFCIKSLLDLILLHFYCSRDDEMRLWELERWLKKRNYGNDDDMFVEGARNFVQFHCHR